MAEKQVTLGRIVHYHMDWMGDGNLRTFAAIVVDVRGDGRVLLEVFEVSADLSRHVNRCCHIAEFSPTPSDGCWSWPLEVA